MAAGEFTSHEAAFGGKAQSVTDHKRGAAIPSVGASQAVEEAVFATAVGGLTPMVEVGDRGVAVARVQAKKSVDPAAFASEKPALRTSLAQEEMQRLLQSILAEARREKDVTINYRAGGSLQAQAGMIAYLDGELLDLQPGQAVISTGGVGYEVRRAALRPPAPRRTRSVSRCGSTPTSGRTSSRSSAFPVARERDTFRALIAVAGSGRAWRWRCSRG